MNRRTTLVLSALGLAVVLLGLRGAPASAVGQPAFVALASDTNNQNYLASSADGRIYFTTDAGSSWIERTSIPVGSATVVSIASDSNNQNYLVLLSSGEVFFTTNAGATWAARSPVFGTTTAAPNRTFGQVKIGDR